MSKDIEPVISRFLRYVNVDTQSNPRSKKTPSSSGQTRLAKMLNNELVLMGANDVIIDEYGYVYATLPATATRPDGTELPTLGFIAHMDTSPACSGRNVQPQMFRDYQGGPLAINVAEDIILSPHTYPALSTCIGRDLITSDGTTLLGADDKAGIAEIMAMAETLLGDESIEHPRIRIAFTIDEEIGRSFENFDIKTFDADYAYTVDGSGDWGKIEYENFNAAKALVTTHGVSIHPGNAKGVMKNATVIAMEFFDALPPNERPENTEGYRGFFMLEGLQGNVGTAQASYLIRDHSRRKFESKKQLMYSIARGLDEKYGEGTVECSIKDSYYNMRDKIDPDNMHLVTNAKKAVRLCGGDPEEAPVRGGTDGAYLSYAGLPCPNLSCGGHNFHGRFEFIDRQSMEQIVRLLVALAGIYGSGETTGVDKTPPDEASEQVETAEAEKAAMDSLDKDLTGSFAPVTDDAATTTENEVDAEVDARASAMATGETETDAQAPTDETVSDDDVAEAKTEADTEPDTDEDDDGADAARTPDDASAR